MSHLDRISNIYNEVVDAQTKTIELDRWAQKGVKVSVKYKLADEAAIRKVGKIATNSKRDDAGFVSYLQFHVDHATLIAFDFQDGTETIEFDGFGSEDLSEALNVQNRSAQNNVRALFVADGDVTSYADAIVEWSGFTRKELEDNASGE